MNMAMVFVIFTKQFWYSLICWAVLGALMLTNFLIIVLHSSCSCLSSITSCCWSCSTASSTGSSPSWFSCGSIGERCLRCLLRVFHTHIKEKLSPKCELWTALIIYRIFCRNYLRSTSTARAAVCWCTLRLYKCVISLTREREGESDFFFFNTLQDESHKKTDIQNANSMTWSWHEWLYNAAISTFRSVSHGCCQMSTNVLRCIFCRQIVGEFLRKQKMAVTVFGRFVCFISSFERLRWWETYKNGQLK